MWYLLAIIFTKSVMVFIILKAHIMSLFYILDFVEDMSLLSYWKNVNCEHFLPLTLKSKNNLADECDI